MVGLIRLSTAASPQHRFSVGLKAWAETGSNSPSRKKPKNAVHAIAQMTCFSGRSEAARALWIRTRRWNVMGSLIWVEGPFSILALLIPAWTLLRIGSDDCSLGSGRPREICIFLTAARYVLPVCGARPASARKEINEHSSFSDTGNGLRTLYVMQKV